MMYIVSCFRRAIWVGVLMTLAISGSADDGAVDVRLEQIIAQAKSINPELWAVEMVQERHRGKRMDEVVAHFNPLRGSDEQWSMLSQNGRKPTAKQLRSFQKSDDVTRPPTSYARLALYLANGAELVEEGEGYALYRVPELPEGSFIVRDLDISRYFVAELRVNTASDIPFAEHLRVFAPEAFRVKVLAKLKSASAETWYTRTDGGDLLVDRQTMNVKGSAPFKKIRIDRVTKYRNHEQMRHVAEASPAS